MSNAFFENLAVAFMIVFFVIYIGVIVLMIVSMWKIFQKAGKKGWECIVPFYNVVVYLEIARKPGWWLLLMLIPYLGYIWIIWATNMVCKNFGKDEGFTVGCILLPFVFYPILAFGDAKYLPRENTEIEDANVIDANL